MADTIIGKIRAIITADSSGLDKATDRAEKSLKDLGNQAKKTGAETSVAMRQMAGTLATAFATAKLVQFGKQSVEAASDLAEATNVTREIFGEASREIEAFSKTAAKSLGQSQKVALDGANTFATFGKSAGLAGTDLSNFAIQFSGLASDLASFRNTTPEDAIMAIGAALRGETEPIRRYGVLLNDMALRQEALRMGLVKTTKEALSPQNKVLAAGALIMAQTKDAQGDFARTSDGLANSSRILTANIQDLKAGMGEALLPAAEGVVSILNPLVSGFNALGSDVKTLVGQVVMLNAVVLLAGRTLKTFGVAASTVQNATIGINAALLAVVAVGKIFSAGVEGNTAEVKDFTNALTENNAALRNNALQQLAEDDPAVRQYLNTVAEIGLTINDLSTYYKDLSGPAADVRNKLADIANQAFTSQDRLLLLNKAFGLNIDVQSLTAEKADEVYSRFQNLQFILFNVEQEWRANTLATDALASAITGVETTAEDAAGALGYASESLDQYKASVLGAAIVSNRNLREATNDTIISTRDFIQSMSEGKVSTQEFENALIEQADSLIALQFATKGEVGALKQVTPAMRYVIESMYRAAEAQGRTRVEAQKLIRELGLLDGIDPQIAIMLTMDVSQVKAQIEQLKKGIEVAKRIGNFQMLAGLTRELEALVALGDAISQVGDFTPSIGGGGGGGGEAEDPYAWVEDWVKDLAAFTKKVMDSEFSDRLIEMSAKDIGKALADLVDEAVQVGVSLLDGGTFVALVNQVSEQLQAAASQLGGPGGLEERFAEATRKVEKFKDALADLEQRFYEFQRAERGIGSYTTLERLDQELALLEEIKAQVQEAEDAYRDFRGESVSALDEQLSSLDKLRSNLESLRQGYDALNASVAGDAALSPIQREQKELDRLKASLDEVTRARASYAQSIEQQASSIQYADRGGALFTAKRWLQKASAFRDVISGLRDRAFPVAIIRDVLNAGIDGGTKLGRKLLALSDTDLAELKRVQQQISAVAAETGEIAASVLFDADISAADSAFKNQLSLVQQLYQQAIAQADTQFQAQQAVVDGMFQQQLADAKAALEQQKVVVEALFQTALAEAKQLLRDAEDVAQGLETAINDLKDTMRELITSLIDALTKATQQPESGGGASGGTGTVPTGDLIPGTNIPVVRGIGDIGTPAPGQDVGGPDRLWGGPGGGGVVDGIYIPPGIDWAALGRRADGGSVLANNPYMVGERGPELFVPNRSGGIVSAEDLAMVGAGRGPSTYNITVNARGDASEVGRQVVRAIQEYERRNGTGWRSQ